MPYIKQVKRNLLDAAISDLAADICDVLFESGQNNAAGVLNYCITELIGKIYSLDDGKYESMALVTGVLENVKQEYYRRKMAKYEDTKIQMNGDVEAYKE